MTRLLVASTLYQVASLAAMIDAGAFADDRELVLVLANGAGTPELSGRIQDGAGFELLAARFDRYVDFTALLLPRRPAHFDPRSEDLPMWEALLRSHWGLGSEAVELVVESIQVNPAIALCRIFHGAGITVHSDGLMSYGPTRNELPRQLAQRLDALIYIDLVPGLLPLLLHEHDPALFAVPAGYLRAVFEQLAAADTQQLPAPVAGGCALVLGQYLSSLGLIDTEQEAALHRSMLTAATERGITEVYFKPHPSAGPGATARLATDARALGVALHLIDSPMLAETLLVRLRPALVISAFSTALATAAYLFDLPVAAIGTADLLHELAPYQNSNRIPLTLIHALFVQELKAPAAESADDSGAPGQVQELTDAVAYAMASARLPGLRAGAESFLSANPDTIPVYFKRRRLTALGLPGALMPLELEANPEASVQRRLVAGAPASGRQLARDARRAARSARTKTLRVLAGGLDRAASKIRP